jgi:hypothetical protein
VGASSTPGRHAQWRWLVLAWVAGCGAPAPTAVAHDHALGVVEPGVWTLHSEIAPPARWDASLTWDSTGNQLILFGGQTYGGYLNDIWSSWPLAWSNPCPTCTSSPPARADHAAAFDATRGVLVIYGGTAGFTYFDDTWEWNGTWSQRCSGCAPGARTLAVMAWDPVNGHVILFGGGPGPTPLNDTWQWDGTSWTKLSPASSPSARFGPAVATDTVRNRVLLFGGYPGYGGRTFNDTWEWDGAKWNPLCTSTACQAIVPPGREQAGLAFDPIRRRAVLFGAYSDAATWEWDGATWLSTATTGPLPLSGPSLAWFPPEKRVWLFGGSSGGGSGFNDTWAYHARGGPCASPADCDGLGCVDGVCCESTACNTCERCDGPGTAGVCATVTNAIDPDTCTGTQICDASGTCKLQIGQPCATVGDCASAVCAGGVCCNRACTLGCETCNPVGAPGTCVAAPAGTVVAACGAYRCNGANADCPIACASDGDCAPGFYCNSGACSTALPHGMACTLDRSCQSGHCVDGVCCDSACTGRCQYCGSGTCAVPVGSDPRGDCAGDPGCAGACRADGSCAFPGAETSCDVCKVCNGSGRCNQPPRSGDDARCGSISCAALSSECRTFADVARRCVDVGLCAQPNDPAVCVSSSDAPDGTPCTGGACLQGMCEPPSPDAGGSASRGGGCSMVAQGRATGGNYGALLVMLLIAFSSRRRTRSSRRAPGRAGRRAPG